MNHASMIHHVSLTLVSLYYKCQKKALSNSLSVLHYQPHLSSNTAKILLKGFSGFMELIIPYESIFAASYDSGLILPILPVRISIYAQLSLSYQVVSCTIGVLCIAFFPFPGYYISDFQQIMHFKGANMGYESVKLGELIKIDEIYSMHYFEYMNNFIFEGESHDFWEFCFVDKGEVGITSGLEETVLKKGDIAFHQPNEFHNVKANGEIAPNLIVISFKCDSRHMEFFKNKILRVDEIERNLLADIIIEARHKYQGRLDDPYLTKLIEKTQEDYFASGQLIKIYLEHLLIHLIRRYSNQYLTRHPVLPRISKTTKLKSDEEIYNRVTTYLEEHLNSKVTIDQICRDNLVGRSQLQKIFRDRSGLGIIEYFSQMKITAAKQMIRTNRMNFTQISERLGYTSIHYFSRQFKKLTNMTPSEYASSVKAMAEGSFK